MLKYSVPDSGIAMLPDMVSLMFQSFTLIDNTIARKFGVAVWDCQLFVPRLN